MSDRKCPFLINEEKCGTKLRNNTKGIFCCQCKNIICNAAISAEESKYTRVVQVPKSDKPTILSWDNIDYVNPLNLPAKSITDDKQLIWPFNKPEKCTGHTMEWIITNQAWYPMGLYNKYLKGEKFDNEREILLRLFIESRSKNI